MTWERVFELVLILIASFLASRVIRQFLTGRHPPPTCQVHTGEDLLLLNCNRKRCGDRLLSLSVGKFDQALDLYNEAKFLGFLPLPMPERVTKALSLAALRSNRPDLVFTFVRDFFQSSITPSSGDLCASVIKFATSRHMCKEALAFFDQLFDRPSPQPTDFAVYSCLLYCSIEASEPWRAKSLFALIPSSRVTSKDVGNFVRALCLRGELQEAQKLVAAQNQENLDPQVFVALALALIKEGDLPEVDRILNRHIRKLDSSGIVILLNSLAILRSMPAVTLMAKLLMRLPADKSLSVTTFAGLAAGFARHQPDRLSLLDNFATVECREVAVVNLADESYPVSSADEASVREVGDSLLQGSLFFVKRLSTVSTDCGVAVISATARAEGPVGAVVRDLVLRGFQVDAIVVLEVLQKTFGAVAIRRTEGGAFSPNPVGVFQSLCQLVEPNSVAVNLVLNVLLDQERFSEAYDFIHEVLPSVGFEPEVSQFLCLYSAAVKNFKNFIARETLAALLHFHNARIADGLPPLVPGEDVVALFLEQASDNSEALNEAKLLFDACDYPKNTPHFHLPPREA